MRRVFSFILVTAASVTGMALAACTPGAPPAPTPTLSPGAIATATESARITEATILAGSDVTPIPEGTIVDDAVASPIKATFYPDRQATEYAIDPVLNTYVYGWEPVPCGSATRSDDGLTMTWVHAHPPCDPTTSHDGVTIKAVIFVTVSDGIGRTIICEYKGAETGTGTACKWGGFRQL